MLATEVRTIEQARQFLQQQERDQEKIIPQLPPGLQGYATPAGITRQSSESDSPIYFVAIKDIQLNHVDLTLHWFDGQSQSTGQAAGSRR